MLRFGRERQRTYREELLRAMDISVIVASVTLGNFVAIVIRLHDPSRGRPLTPDRPGRPLGVESGSFRAATKPVVMAEGGYENGTPIVWPV
ncbi:hypothetical protein ANO11243_049420 [Dothideomycetidae sp. 11243]|nr:hypothetical protein ANO11243_049420 [fungal sp. No.11243]